MISNDNELGTAWWQYFAAAAVIAITLCQAFSLVLFAVRRAIIKGRYPLYTNYCDKSQLRGFGCSSIMDSMRIRLIMIYSLAWSIGLVLVQWWYKEEIIDVVNSLVDKTITTFERDKKNGAFHILKMDEARSFGGMHPTARSTREVVIKFIKNLARSTGKIAVPLIGSKHFPGSSRTVFDVTDPGGRGIPENVNDLIIPCIDNFDLVPLCYYGDMIDAGATVVNYTYCVSEASFGDDTRAYFMENGDLVIQVQSAEGLPATYRHKIVRHNHDKVLFPLSNGGFVLCEIRSRYVGYNRILYQYTRLAYINSDIKMFLSLIDPLKGYEAVHYHSFYGKQSVVFNLYDHTIIGRIGHPEWYSLRNEIFDNVIVASKDNSYSMNSLKNHTGIEGHPYSLMQLLKFSSDHTMFIRTSTNTKRSFEANYLVDDLKVKYGLSVTPAYIETGAVAAYDSKASSICAIKERILDIRPDPLDQNFAPDDYVDEFVDYLANHTGKLVPLEEEEALNLLSNDKKKVAISSLNRLNKRYFHCSFIKREVYNEVKAHRPISEVDNTFNLEYSRYIKPLTDRLKELKWFAVGIVPQDLEISMSELFDSYLGRLMVECDVSKFDGSQGPRCLGIMRKLLGRVYGDVKSDGLCMEMCNTILKDKHGNYYNSHYTRKSGSRDTTLGNTLVNGFCNYYYYRHYEKLSVDESFSSIGLCHGDDYIGLVINSERYEKAWNDNGFRVKLIDRSERDYATFLGRVWMSRGQSFLDPLRHFPKIHLTTGVEGDDPYRKMADKWGGLYAQDVGSVVGETSSKLLRWVCGVRPELCDGKAYIDRMDQYGTPISDLLTGDVKAVWHSPPLDVSKRYFARVFALTDAQMEELLSNDPSSPDWKTLVIDTNDYSAIVDGHTTGEPKEAPPLTLSDAKSDQICFRQFILNKTTGGRYVPDCSSCSASHVVNICHNFLLGKCRRENCPRYHASDVEIRVAKQLSK